MPGAPSAPALVVGHRQPLPARRIEAEAAARKLSELGLRLEAEADSDRIPGDLARLARPVAKAHALGAVVSEDAQRIDAVVQRDAAGPQPRDVVEAFGHRSRLRQ